MRTRAAFLLLAVAGCKSVPPAPDPLANLPPGCEAMLPSCLAVQKICAAGPVCQRCPDGEYATTAGVCSPIGTALTHDFATFTAQAGQEILGLCQSWTLDNPTELWINAVEMTQDEASHHSNWLYVPDDKYPGPDGVWKCADRNYHELTAALEGGVLYAQSTQAPHEVQKFPNGAAVRIPPYSRIISDVHILNASPQPVTGHIRLAIYPLAAADVKVKLAPFHLTFNVLDIPPKASSRSTADCEIDSQFQSALNHGLDARIYFILPHYHALGRRFFVQHMGGARDGAPIFESIGISGDAHGLAFDPPIDLTGDDGLRFGCDFENDTEQTVQWGFGNQEMCEFLGFSDSPLSWESSIGVVHSVPPAMGAPATYTGPCPAVAFKYDFTKPGGPPPDGGQ
jgi:hypothetical protein